MEHQVTPTYLSHHLPMAIRLCLTIKVFLKVKITFVLAGFHSTSSSNMLIFQFHFEYTGAWTVVLISFLYNLPGRLVDPKLFRNSFEIISVWYISTFLQSLSKNLFWLKHGIPSDITLQIYGCSGDEASMLLEDPDQRRHSLFITQAYSWPERDTNVVGVEI